MHQYPSNEGEEEALPARPSVELLLVLALDRQRQQRDAQVNTLTHQAEPSSGHHRAGRAQIIDEGPTFFLKVLLCKEISDQIVEHVGKPLVHLHTGTRLI